MRFIAVCCAGFPGRSTRRPDPMPRDARRPVLICDLDGTILRVNSFPLWILYLIAGRLPELGFGARGSGCRCVLNFCCCGVNSAGSTIGN